MQNEELSSERIIRELDHIVEGNTGKRNVSGRLRRMRHRR